MKKFTALFIILLSVLFLYSCDYPEKSFIALHELDVPIEVTDDFILPKGKIGLFIWSSDNESIMISGLQAKVTQINEDVLVVLTATINQTSQNFEVLVLKIGSVSIHNRAEKVHKLLTEKYTTLTSVPLLMPNIFDDLYLRYSNSTYSNFIGDYIDEDGNQYFANNYKKGIDDMYIYVYYYKDEKESILVYLEKLYFSVEPMQEDDEFYLALKELNISDYHYKNGVIEIKTFKVNDYIEFSNSTNIDFQIYLDNKFFIETNDNKFQLIKIPPNSNGLITKLKITIGKMTKSIDLKLSFTI